MQKVWEIFCENWSEVTQSCGVRLHAFVLMSNHFHAVLTTPNANLDVVMQYILRETARAINTRAQRINHVFGGPYEWSLICNQYSYERISRYVFANPVKVGLCERVEDYSFSTLHTVVHRKPSLMPLSESIFDFGSMLTRPLEDRLEWLNQSTHPSLQKEIRRCLSRGEVNLSPEDTLIT